MPLNATSANQNIPKVPKVNINTDAFMFKNHCTVAF